MGTTIDLAEPVVGEWREHAACKDVDPGQMTPDTAAAADIELAKWVCGRCPLWVRDQCHQAAEADPNTYGVWAGQWWGESPKSPEVVHCGWCEAPLEQSTPTDGRKGGRLRAYCNATHRQAASRAAKAASARMTA